MDKSKKIFSFFLLLLLLVVGAGIAVLIIFRNKNSEEPSPKSSKIGENPFNEAKNDDAIKMESNSGSLTNTECRTWLRSSKKPIQYFGRFTKSRIATRESVLAGTGHKIVRNAYWLTGVQNSDSESLDGILYEACMGKIPVVVIRIRPTQGLRLSHVHSNWDYYKPQSVVESWEDYDVKLKRYLQVLNDVPAIIILEPDLLMFTYDSKNPQHRWNNEKYEDQFLLRAQRVIKKLSKARVYVDAGNAVYLGESLANLDQMAKTLLRLKGLRGFSINTLHFVNQTYNEFIARKLFCRTGLHYVVDTSRNGGSFSKLPLPKVEECLFDPPDMKQGQFPGWAWGSQKPLNAPRLKRWIHQIGSTSSLSNSETNEQDNNPFRFTTRPPPRSQPVMDRNDQNWKVNQFNNMINNQNNNKMNNENPNNIINGGLDSRTNSNNHNRNNNNANNNRNGRQDQRIFHSPIASTPDSTTEASLSLRTVDVATQYLRSFKSTLRSCVSRKSNTQAHDANVWLKAAGESDGRLYRFGMFRSCLIDHSIPCDDSCQMYVQTNTESRDPNCQCNSNSNPNFPSVNSRLSPGMSFPVNDLLLN